jgi:5'-nucleotidase
MPGSIFYAQIIIFQIPPLEGRIKPFKVYKKAGIKIGVFGLGIELNGLVDKKLYGNLIYIDPVETAKNIVKMLIQDEKCDYIVCLSHLGFKSENNKINDQLLAEQTCGIDLIIGGHTHTFLEAPVVKSNSQNKEVMITQVGWAGIWLGRIDLFFSRNTQIQANLSGNIFINNRWD